MTVNVSKQLDRAKRFLEKNRVEDAVETYQAVLNRGSPGHAESLQALGDLYTRLGQVDRALTYYGMLFDRLCEFREEQQGRCHYIPAHSEGRATTGRAHGALRAAAAKTKSGRSHRTVHAGVRTISGAREGRAGARLPGAGGAAAIRTQAERQFAVGELATRVGKNAAEAARAFLRAAQLFDASKAPGDAQTALELLERAHRIAPHDRSPALLYAQAQLRRGDAAAAVQTLEPFTSSELDAATLATLGEALMQTGALGRARGIFERLPPDQAGTSVKLFDLAGRYLSAGNDAGAVALLGRMQKDMIAARHESEFATQLDALVEAHRKSLILVEFWAAAYAALNREVKYFDALVRLFDMYLEAGNILGAGEALEKLVDIDAYDSRHQQRLDRLKGRADAAFLARMRTRLSQLATNTSDGIDVPANELGR